MKNLKSKLAAVAALLVGVVAMSFAMTENKSEVKQADTMYYVTGLDSNGNYQISQDPSNALPCSSGNDACRFTSPDSDLGSSIDKEAVDTETAGIHVEAWRTF
ncbi:DUF6520 family protein [Sphingobacterium sp.]|uniref:DUF6520 family protein n=1 Tax=Sphingobacterium sp. TaxID=341027 RepID=UPI00258F753B|nr:DUF6520 family protein [Sphingobacterium sp.]WET69097.1 MAG: DUF6520 family protein [Sphingobacterium sp.]